MSTFDAFGRTDRYIGTVNLWITNDDVARIQDGRGLLLSVQYGTVWITQAGSVKDVFVAAGDTFLIEHDGRTLVSLGGAQSAAAVTLMPSVRRAPALARRLAAALGRLSLAGGTHMRWLAGASIRGGLNRAT